MKRWIITILLFLLLGAIVNVAVAWGCAAWSPITDGDFRSATECEVAWLEKRGESGGPDSSVGNDYGFGITEKAFLLYDSELQKAMDEFDYEEELEDGTIVWTTVEWKHRWGRLFEAGWPCRSLAGEHCDHSSGWRNVHTSEAVSPWGYEIIAGAAVASPRAEFIKRILPFRPVLPGFFANTISYATTLWTLVCGPFVVRRLNRRKHGRCPECGYDLRGELDAGCSECGWGREVAEVA